MYKTPSPYVLPSLLNEVEVLQIPGSTLLSLLVPTGLSALDLSVPSEE